MEKIKGGTGATEEVRRATERAERAEAEVARLKEEVAGNTDAQPPRAASETEPGMEDGESRLRKDSMMAHLLDSLGHRQDIGHYGRLVFVMVARHFMQREELLGWLTRDPDFNELKARALIRQVEEHGYNPPKRERVLEWQREQNFPILPDPEDPDCGNVYRNLKFPDPVYKHIEEYQERKETSTSPE